MPLAFDRPNRYQYPHGVPSKHDVDDPSSSRSAGRVDRRAVLVVVQHPTSDSQTRHPQTDQPVITAQPAGYNADDVAFATNMIPHHEQAVELSAMVPDRSTNAGLVALARADLGRAATGDRCDEGVPGAVEEGEGTPTSYSGRAGHGSTMQGMVDAATTTKLESMSSEEFDELWLASMISHHQGAIEMAKAEIANGDNVDAKTLAKQHRHHAGSRDRPDEADAGRLK